MKKVLPILGLVVIVIGLLWGWGNPFREKFVFAFTIILYTLMNPLANKNKTVLLVDVVLTILMVLSIFLLSFEGFIIVFLIWTMRFLLYKLFNKTTRR